MSDRTKKKRKRIFPNLPIGVKMAIGVIAITLALSVIALAIGTNIQRGMKEKDYEEDTWKLARSVAIMMDGADTAGYIDRVREIYETIPAELKEALRTDLNTLSGVNPNDPESQKLDPVIQRYQENSAKFQAYFEPMFTDEYFATEALLNPTAIENEVSMIGILIADREYEWMIEVFVSYGYDEGIFGAEGEHAAGSWVNFYDGFSEYLENGGTGQFTINYGDPGKKGTFFLSAAPYYRPGTKDVIAYVAVADLWDEVVEEQEVFFRRFLVGVLIAAGVMLLLAELATRRVIIDPIRKMSAAANAYSTAENKLDQTFFRDLDIKTGDEIESLASAMQQMEGDLSGYFKELTAVTAEKERIGAELNVAAKIQAGMLPRIFPPFPDRCEFDIYAVMDPAKEVGGDFYDFYWIDDDHLVLTIADVSGKGIPASLFMVISKTILKNRTLTGGSPAEILTAANHLLCEGNASSMFVTVWLGILTVSTGDLICANGGHEHPAMRRGGGPYELIVTKHKPMLGAIDGLTYVNEEYHLDPGDALFLYTDGVPEASAADDSMYKTDRMIDALNALPADAGAEETLRAVHESVDAFVGDAPQFDDLTMLGFRYFGPGGKP